jgi:hypothetical protein
MFKLRGHRHISTGKTKDLAFEEKNNKRHKMILNNKMIEQTLKVNYLEYHMDSNNLYE